MIYLIRRGPTPEYLQLQNGSPAWTAQKSTATPFHTEKAVQAQIGKMRGFGVLVVEASA